MIPVIDNPGILALYARQASTAEQQASSNLQASSQDQDAAIQPAASPPAYPAKTLVLDAGRYRVADTEK